MSYAVAAAAFAVSGAAHGAASPLVPLWGYSSSKMRISGAAKAAPAAKYRVRTATGNRPVVSGKTSQQRSHHLRQSDFSPSSMKMAKRIFADRS